jgi:hypothetical protein
MVAQLKQVRNFSEENAERIAVIARCGMECSAACRTEAKGNDVR